MAKPEKKQEKPKVFNPELTIGGGDENSRATIQCEDCDNVNFVIQIEPDYADSPNVKENFDVTARRVMFCPFCGGEELSEV